MIKNKKVILVFLWFVFLLCSKNIATTITIEDQPFQNLSIYTRKEAFEFHKRVCPVLADWKDNHQNAFVKNWSIVFFDLFFIQEIEIIDSKLKTKNLSRVLNILKSSITPHVNNEKIKDIIKFLVKIDFPCVEIDVDGLNFFLKELEKNPHIKRLSQNVYFLFLEGILTYVNGIQNKNPEIEKKGMSKIVLSAWGGVDIAIKIIERFCNQDLFNKIESHVQLLSDDINDQSIKKMIDLNLFFSCITEEFLNIHQSDEGVLKRICKDQFNLFMEVAIKKLEESQKNFFDTLNASLTTYAYQQKKSGENFSRLVEKLKQFGPAAVSFLGLPVIWYFSDSPYNSVQYVGFIFSFSGITLSFAVKLIDYIEKINYIQYVQDEISICSLYYAFLYKDGWIGPQRLFVEIKNFLESNSFDPLKTLAQNIITHKEGEA
ncbi:MAG: hypothetical protein CNLJKLNK_00861 [Holosporales bacterium]